ncbi:Pumilio y domain member 6 [Elasticomyces elasticus]|nr:Pumilio y domain member 6 [Elasticomyces elasticus]KAK3624772.1 Pumilio y domain member 6 [Elasticomyces elasticus]KAK4925397.1 Pumilio y domain member 6 [Elasticomyces elasticus]KAK5744851.1 Pumilio y domain member 6 [Elasticomyces elasticus]
MGGIKRKEAPSKVAKDVKKQKTVETKKSKLDLAAEQTDDEFGGFDDEPEEKSTSTAKSNISSDPKKFKLESSSAEAHAKQRQQARERKAGKPNADAIARSKKIWERLRRKSHVPAAERKELVTELFEIITGRVRDFVFKHDSVRVIQCALKYADKTQRRIIVDELRSDVRALAESRYGKFLVAKMVVEGDQAVRDIIAPEFYGHVKRLMNHPEAGWIVDDIYRQIASSRQKAVMLREWYGTEFALANRDGKLSTDETTSDLKVILEENPEKRRPILDFLHQIINSFLQKKLTAFTMLHDGMLQYFLALEPNTEPHTAFLDLMKADIETKVEAKDSNDASGGGDLFRNLAFTKSGSRLVCLALAYGSAKDRKIILRCFKDTVQLMAFDQYAKMVLVTGLDVPDDTKMSGKAIVSELAAQSVVGSEEMRLNTFESVAISLTARVPLLYPLAGAAKWLMNEQDKTILEEVHAIRATTSKKDPELRRKGLLEYLAPPVLDLVTQSASNLVKTSFGCQVITETLLEAHSEGTADARNAAKQAVAELAQGDPNEEGHVALDASAGRMLKTLVLGGAFDATTKTTKMSEPRLGFAEALYPIIKDRLVEWACSPSSFVVVSLLESEDVEGSVKAEVREALKKAKKAVQKAADGEAVEGDAKGKKEGKAKGNAGARILLEKMSG